LGSRRGKEEEKKSVCVKREGNLSPKKMGKIMICSRTKKGECLKILRHEERLLPYKEKEVIREDSLPNSSRGRSFGKVSVYLLLVAGHCLCKRNGRSWEGGLGVNGTKRKGMKSVAPNGFYQFLKRRLTAAKCVQGGNTYSFP